MGSQQSRRLEQNPFFVDQESKGISFGWGKKIEEEKIEYKVDDSYKKRKTFEKVKTTSSNSLSPMDMLRDRVKEETMKAGQSKVEERSLGDKVVTNSKGIGDIVERCKDTSNRIRIDSGFSDSFSENLYGSPRYEAALIKRKFGSPGYEGAPTKRKFGSPSYVGGPSKRKLESDQSTGMYHSYSFREGFFQNLP